MGYILNRFDKLMELKEDPTVNEQFKLTAIIVHDPKDNRLKKHIRDHFLHFAELTGKEFLFITFIQPPQEYTDALKRGEYQYAKLLVSDLNQLSNTDDVINPFIRDFYDIPDEGSYMVLSEKLSNKEVYKIRITTESLPYQLMYLTSYCKCPNDFGGLIEKLNAEPFNINVMLVDSLLKIVSLISPSSPPNEYGLFSYSQYEKAKRTIKEEKQKLLSALKQSTDDEDLTNKVLELYKLIEYVCMNVLNEGEHFFKKEKDCINYNMLDSKSKKFWNTYSRLCNFIGNAYRDELDYSAFILYLGKIVETELNLSVCQMLRQSMGIEMPAFYNRYCGNIGQARIPTARQDVSLNRYSNNDRRKLETVPLGNLLHAYMTAVGREPSSIPNWRVNNPNSLREIHENFLNIWEEISWVRNDAAHSNAVDEGKYQDAEGLFNVFLAEYIQYFYDMKRELRQ